MTAAIELQQQFVLVLKSEHKLRYFNMLQQGNKICSIKNSSLPDSLHKNRELSSSRPVFSIHFSILALRNLCDSNKQAVGTNVEMQDLRDKQRKLTQA